MQQHKQRFKAMAAKGRHHAGAVYRSRHTRRIALWLLIALIVFGLLGFLIAPGILRSQLQQRLSQQLQRPVSIAAVHVDPYTLRLELDGLHISERDGSAFIDASKVVVNAGWASLWYRAPVLDELRLEQPRIHLIRDGEQHFNFSDIVQRLSTPPGAKPQPAQRFALSNISVVDGAITLDDQVLHAQHTLDQLNLGIPFLANLPHDVDLYVQPLLAFRLDGSPLHIGGQSKPFAEHPEADLQLHLDHLDLPRYLGYLPGLPAKVERGQLSGDVAIRFIETPPTQTLLMQGGLALDDAAISTPRGPLLQLAHATVTLGDVQPFRQRYWLTRIELDQLQLHVDQYANGSNNFSALATPSTPTHGKSDVTDLAIGTLLLSDASMVYRDEAISGAQPLQLDHLQGKLEKLSSTTDSPAKLDIQSAMGSGKLSLQGQVWRPSARFEGEFKANNVDLPPLLALSAPLFNGKLSQGKLDAQLNLQVNAANTLNYSLKQSTIAIRDASLDQGHHTPASWKNLQLAINQFDSKTQLADIGVIALQGLHLSTTRSLEGHYDLNSLLLPGDSKSPPWHWQVQQLQLRDAQLDITALQLKDHPRQVSVKTSSADVGPLSPDMHKPITLAISGSVQKGSFTAQGTVTPTPLDADLRIQANRLNIAPFAALIEVPLNVRVDSAQLGGNGHLRYRQHGDNSIITYQGRGTLNRVRVADKLTDDDFLSWDVLNVSGMSVRLGDGAPQITLGDVALDGPYARVIINSDGHLNVQDVIANPAQTPVSVTRSDTTQPNVAPSASAPLPAAAASAAAAANAAVAAAQVHVGGIALENGHLNYTDDFIKPNYTANITQLAGKIGAFGTDTADQPAALNLQGTLDDDSPVDIEGSVNPLTPEAMLDIKGSAHDVELTHLTSYSGKYAGYPITRGRLSMDVHYQLDHGKLDADNHLVLNQLTFGDRMDGPGISHLPVKLAVALLKDSNGNIDIHVPVSGSLRDPHFSMGGVIWQAIVNVLKRAVTSPFRLLASASSSKQDLGYIVFAPGSDQLDTTAQSRLDQLVGILTQKTSLKLDISGRADPALDADGLRKVSVDQAVQKEAFDDLGTKAVPLKRGSDDYNHYLEKAYKHADFKKERNLIGLTKSQPPETMINLLEQHVDVDQDAMRHLAERRADAARRYLHGKLDDNRVFVIAPKLGAQGIDDGGKSTRDDFGLH